MDWDGSAYHTLSSHYKERFGGKVYKLSLDGGMTCPNRDGTLGNRGCIFCSGAGSGDFASHPTTNGITAQLSDAMRLVAPKLPKSGVVGFIPYFQAFTNTYAPVEYLEEIFTQAIEPDYVVGLSVATRPDCLEPEKIELLAKLNRVKPVYVELGLQTIKEETARFIRRGYDLSVYDDSVNRLKEAGINTVVHAILGLPWEDEEDMFKTCRYICDSGADGIKLQLLHVLKDTDLSLYIDKFKTMSLKEYVSLVVSIIEELPPQIVVHRITGDGPRDLLLSPLWSLDKKNVLNTITKEFAIRNTWQGKKYGR